MVVEVVPVVFGVGEVADRRRRFLQEPGEAVALEAWFYRQTGWWVAYVDRRKAKVAKGKGARKQADVRLRERLHLREGGSAAGVNGLHAANDRVHTTTLRPQVSGMVPPPRLYFGNAGPRGPLNPQ
jgi:hypothetical protein